MMKYFKYLPILALALLTACASSFNSDVTRFHKLSKPGGETFQIEPLDKSKVGSLEFAQYANLVGDNLVALGYRATPQGGTPDLLVKLDYTVDSGQVRVNSYPGMGYPYGYGRWGNPYFYDPFYPYGYPYGFGYEPEIRSVVYYTRRLIMNIDRPSAEPGKSGEKLFEGRVESEGTDNRLPEVMPYMVKALFSNFPGQSGVTQHIVIEKDGSKKY